jgi:hypothetical protein
MSSGVAAACSRVNDERILVSMHQAIANCAGDDESTSLDHSTCQALARIGAASEAVIPALLQFAGNYSRTSLHSAENKDFVGGGVFSR